MTDDRVLGKSYGYVEVPASGAVVDGVKFPAGPRAAGKHGWYPLLLAAGCEKITQEEYERTLAGGPRAKKKRERASPVAA